MTRVLVARDHNEALRQRRGAAWYGQRIFWFAQDGDVVILPGPPDEAYLEYVTGLTGTRRETLSVLVAPADGETGQLTAARLLEPGFLDTVRSALGGRPVEEFRALWPDAATAALAAAVGQAAAFPGAGYFSQGGDILGNSKALFRMIAAGNGVPIAPGAVCVDPGQAERALREIFAAGQPAILKNEFASGGWGNEILTRGAPVAPMGAHRMTQLTGDSSISSYLQERWAALSGAGRHRVVVEQYYPGSKTVFAEYSITEAGHTLGALGGLVPALFDVAAQVLPVQGLTDGARERLLDGAERMCRALHAVGYRGTLSPDAIVTPADEVVFTEHNGRMTGSTHTYAVIGHKVVGSGYGTDRLILERASGSTWNLDSFADGCKHLEDAGLAYNPETRSGVVFVVPLDPNTRAIPYCIVAESMAAAGQIEAELARCFDFNAPPVLTGQN